jgi:hypothetical protein
MVLIAVLGGARLPVSAQTPAPASLPDFSGVWAPSDAARSDTLFDVGLSVVPGRGRMTIDQRVNRITISISMTDDKLEPLMAISGRFYASIIYGITSRPARQGGFGAAGPPELTVPTWVGDRLVIPDARPAQRKATWTLSREGDRLKVETKVEGRANTITEWFSRVGDVPR